MVNVPLPLPRTVVSSSSAGWSASWADSRGIACVEAVKFMTTYHNDTIMVTRNGREIHVNADEETLIVGDVHAHNQEERSEIKGSVVVREGGRVVVNDMDVENTIDGLSNDMDVENTDDGACGIGESAHGCNVHECDYGVLERKRLRYRRMPELRK